MNALEEQKQGEILQSLDQAIQSFGTTDELYPVQSVEPVQQQAPLLEQAPLEQAPLEQAPLEQAPESGILLGEPSSVESAQPGVSVGSQLPQMPTLYSGASPQVYKDPVGSQANRIKLGSELLGGNRPSATTSQYQLDPWVDAQVDRAWHHYLFNPIPTVTTEGYSQLFPGYYYKNIGVVGSAFDWLLTPLRAGYGVLADTQRGYYMLRRYLANTPGGRWFNNYLDILNQVERGEIPANAVQRYLAGKVGMVGEILSEPFIGTEGLDQAINLFNQPNMFPGTRDEGASGRFISMFPNLTAGVVGASMSAFDTTAQTRQGSDLTFSLGSSAEFTNPYSGTFLGWRNPFTGERVFDIEKFANTERELSPLELAGAAAGWGALFVSDILNPVNLLLDIPVDKAARAIGNSSFWQATVNPLLERSGLLSPITFNRQAKEATDVQLDAMFGKEPSWEEQLTAQLREAGVDDAEIANTIERTRAGLAAASPGGDAATYATPEEAIVALQTRMQARGMSEAEAAELAERVRVGLEYNNAGKIVDPDLDEAADEFEEVMRMVNEAVRTEELEYLKSVVDEVRTPEQIAQEAEAVLEQLDRLEQLTGSTDFTDTGLIRDGDFLVWDSDFNVIRPANASELTVGDVKALNSRNNVFVWDGDTNSLKYDSPERLTIEQFRYLQEEHGLYWDGDKRGFVRRVDTPEVYVPAGEARTEAEALLEEYDLVMRAEAQEGTYYVPAGKERTRAEALIAGYERFEATPTPVPADARAEAEALLADYAKYVEDSTTFTYDEVAESRFTPDKPIPRDANIVPEREQTTTPVLRQAHTELSKGRPVPTNVDELGYEVIEVETAPTVEGFRFTGETTSLSDLVDDTIYEAPPLKGELPEPVLEPEPASPAPVVEPETLPETVVEPELVVEPTAPTVRRASSQELDEFGEPKKVEYRDPQDELRPRIGWDAEAQRSSLIVPRKPIDEWAPDWLERTTEPQLKLGLEERGLSTEGDISALRTRLRDALASEYQAPTVPAAEVKRVPENATREQIVQALNKRGLKTTGNINHLRARLQRALNNASKPNDVAKPAKPTTPTTKPTAPVSIQNLQSRLDSIQKAKSRLRKANLREGVLVLDADAKLTMQNLEEAEFVAKQELLELEAQQAAAKVIKAEDTLDVLAATRQALDSGEWKSDLDSRVRSDARRLGVIDTGEVRDVAARIAIKIAELRGNVTSLTVKQLKEALKSLGLSKYYKLNKDGLQDLLIRTYDSMIYDIKAPEVVEVPDNPTAVAAAAYNTKLEQGLDPTPEAIRLNDQLIHENVKELDAAAEQFQRTQQQAYEQAASTASKARKARKQAKERIDATVQQEITAAAKFDVPDKPTEPVVVPARAEPTSVPEPTQAVDTSAVLNSAWGRRAAKLKSQTKDPARQAAIDDVVLMAAKYPEFVGKHGNSVLGMIRIGDINKPKFTDLYKTYPITSVIDAPTPKPTKAEIDQHTLNTIAKLKPPVQISTAYYTIGEVDVDVNQLKSMVSMDDATFAETLFKMRDNFEIELLTEDVLDLTPTDIVDGLVECGMIITKVRFL